MKEFKQIKRDRYLPLEEGKKVLDPKLLDKYLKDNRYSVDKKFIPALAQMMVDEDLSMDDIEDISRGNYGYGQTVSFGRNGPEWWFVTDKEADRAAEESIESIVDEMGVQSFNKNFWMGHIDWKKMKSEMESDETRDFEERFEEDGGEGQAEYVDWDEVNKIILSKTVNEKKWDRDYMNWLEGNGITPSDHTDRMSGKLNTKTWENAVKDFVENDALGADLLEAMNDAGDLGLIAETASANWWKEEDIEDHMDNIWGLDSEEFSDFVVKNGFIDQDALIKDAIISDGKSHFLGTYDGEEHNLKNIDYYRTN